MKYIFEITQLSGDKETVTANTLYEAGSIFDCGWYAADLIAVELPCGCRRQPTQAEYQSVVNAADDYSASK